MLIVWQMYFPFFYIFVIPAQGESNQWFRRLAGEQAVRRPLLLDSRLRGNDGAKVLLSLWQQPAQR
jgi:hypothetical protein